MGASLSCDQCDQPIQEGWMDDSPSVWVTDNKDLPKHLCDKCFTKSDETSYARTTAYMLIGQENARRLNESSQYKQDFATVMDGFKSTITCECGMEIVVHPDTDECFSCRRPVRKPL